MNKNAFVLIIIAGMASTAWAQSGKTTVKYIKAEGENVPFSPAVIVGNMIYLAGQLGGSASGGLVPGGIGPETKQTLENIKAALEKNGSSMDKVIKCTCMLADMKDWAAMNAEYVKFFPKHLPARSSFGTTGLAMGARVEIECMAYIK